MSQEETTRRDLGVGGKIAIAAGAVLVLLAGTRIYVSVRNAGIQDEENARKMEQEMAALRARLPELKGKVKPKRMEMIDGQCAHRGDPPYGFVYQGGKEAENAVVAIDAGCVSFTKAPVRNISSFFCCPTETPKPAP